MNFVDIDQLVDYIDLFEERFFVRNYHKDFELDTLLVVEIFVVVGKALAVDTEADIVLVEEENIALIKVGIVGLDIDN